MTRPHFGHTKAGHPLHLRTIDYHRADTAYQALNKKVATFVTTKVGTMTCAYFFSVLALASLPAILTEAFHLHFFPTWLITVGLIALVSWITQTYIQLVLLSVILVGQSIAAEASDVRAEKTLEDTETLRSDMKVALDRLDEHTEGGIKAVLDAMQSLHLVVSFKNA